MNCRKVQNRLSAYIDNELKADESDIIKKHLQECLICRQEYNLLKEQRILLCRLEEIEPSPGFREKFWQKVASIHRMELKEAEERKGYWISFIPLPVMAGLLFLVFIQLASFAGTLYAKNSDVRKRILSECIKSFVISPDLLNHATLKGFSRKCYEYVCECAANQECKSGVCGMGASDETK